MLKIALLQIAPCGTQKENLEKGIRYCQKAGESGADIALFPEMWSNGYNIYNRPVDQWTAEAISADSEYVCTFGKLAKKLNMAIGVTLLEKHEKGPRNSLILFDRFGEQKFVYAKVHTCLLQADGREGLYMAELDLTQLRQYREREVHGNAYRQPLKYSLITDTRIEPPFVRSDHR